MTTVAKASEAMVSAILGPKLPTEGIAISRVISIWQNHVKCNNRKTSNISSTLVGNRIVYHSDVDGASPVGAAATKSSFSS